MVDAERAGRHKRRNLWHTLLLMGGMALILTGSSELLLGQGVWPWVFGGVVLVLTLMPTQGGHWLLRAYRARPVTVWEAPRLLALVEELARRGELERVPALFWVPSASLNAFSVGSRQDATIAVTDGLLRRLTERELVGVLAHEVAHIVNHDMRLMGLADLVSRMTHVLSLLGLFLVLVSLPLMLAGVLSVSPLALILLLAAPSLSALLQLGLSRVREFDADLEAARLTGDPLGLASALAKLEQETGSWWRRVLLPSYRDRQPSLLRTHPATAERIQRLMELAERPALAFGPLSLSESPWLSMPGVESVLLPPRHRPWFGIWR